MKTIIRSFLLIQSILFLYSIDINAQTFNWAKSIAIDSIGNISRSISVDISGNSFVTGYFYNNIYFGTTYFTSYGSADIFIAKYDLNGNCLWAKQAGSANKDDGYGIAVDVNGNSYVTGYFSGTAVFDTMHLTSFGAWDGFVAKYDPNGNCLWVRQAGGIKDDWSQGIAVDPNGNCYVTGAFGGTSLFGNFQLPGFGNADIFVAKYDPDGNCLWAKQAGGSSGDAGFGIAVDADGNISVAGSFMESSAFGTFQLTSYGKSDIFIAKYDFNGNCLWASKAGGIDVDQAAGIALDTNGNNYITGYFYVTATFDTIPLTSFGGWDIFVAKYNRNGNCLWVKNAGCPYGDGGDGISVDAEGNSYITGQITGTSQFDLIKLNTYGGGDIFIAKYNRDGNCLWANHAGGYNNDEGFGITNDANGNCYVTGFHDSYFDSSTFGGFKLPGSGSFIAKINTIPVSVRPNLNSTPKGYSLQQNYPNPFNPSTTINFSLLKGGYVLLSVYNSMGQEVSKLISQNMNAGAYAYDWDASAFASGVYYYRISAGNYTETKKLLLLK